MNSTELLDLAYALRVKADQTGDPEKYQRAAELFAALGMQHNADGCMARAIHYAGPSAMTYQEAHK